ncbi:MAG: TlpA family protein disulfide reductase [Saprospiraceae bacterium]|nr:TlpA family protein disulfide reductase [Saprospiraceae bacterium]
MKKVKDLLLIPLVFVVIWLSFKWYRMPGQSIGSIAPDFVAYMPNGDSLRLSDYRNQLVFLDFWGSWCGPCREYNKGLARVFEEFKNSNFSYEKQFSVISVGIETDRSNWLLAIENDNLDWEEHVSDLNRLYDHVALLYGIKEIPNNFLIDGDGKIIGVNLRIDQLREILTYRRQK